MTDLPRGKNSDYWEGRRAEAARLEALETARLAARVAPVAARDAAEIACELRRDNALKAAIIARHPQHFYALDQQQVGEMSGLEAAAHSLKEDGWKLRDGEDALRMREAIDHGIKLGFARARGSGDSGPMPFGSHGPAGTHEGDDEAGSMSEAEREEFFKGIKGGPQSAAGLLGVAKDPKRASMDDSTRGSFLDRYLKG